jgi:hypothetical protein
MNGKLTNETYHALRQNTLVLISVIDYCFKTYIDLQYTLAGIFSTDNLEKRFGLYRSLSGCNYNVSYDDLLGAEKKIRVKKIFKKLEGNFSIEELKQKVDMREDSDEKNNYIINKQQKQAYLLDIAVPNSHNITQTYNTKINKYLELSVAMRNLWCLEKI